jgi:CheY-like chemotaxis protein
MPYGHGEAILVVEDNAGLRRVVTRQLHELRYHVLEADNAAQAMVSLEHENVDLLFTDIILPGDQNGLELARRARDRWPQLRVLLTSGFPGRTAGGIDVEAPGRLLTKPYRKADLARALRDGLRADHRVTGSAPV